MEVGGHNGETRSSPSPPGDPILGFAAPATPQWGSPDDGTQYLYVLPDWDQLAASIPDVVATMRRYLDQLGCILRPGSVGGADLALRSLAAFLADHAPEVHAVTDIHRRHLEDFRRCLATRPGRMPLPAGGFTISGMCTVES